MFRAKSYNAIPNLIHEELNTPDAAKHQNGSPTRNFQVQKLAVVIKFPTKNIVDRYTSKMNILRFLAICSIVWGHSLGRVENIALPNWRSQALQIALIELGRVGTVIFFLISGFFLADKIHKHTIISYLRYRLFTLIIPWLSFLTVFVVIQMIHILSLSQVFTQSAYTTLNLFTSLFKAFIFHAAYWFIPVAIVSACLLITFKKYLNNPWFITILLIVTIGYSVNLYYGWISANHTKAFLGYVFFMWLGMQLKYRVQEFCKLSERLSWSLISITLAALFVASCFEGEYLKYISSGDAYASIRLSNWLLSIGIFVAVLKTDKWGWINHLKPQYYVYGVYLVHNIVVAELAPFVYNHFAKRNLMNSFPHVILMQFAVFILVMVLSYFLAFCLKHSPLRYNMALGKRRYAS